MLLTSIVANCSSKPEEPPCGTGKTDGKVYADLSGEKFLDFTGDYGQIGQPTVLIMNLMLEFYQILIYNLY